MRDPNSEPPQPGAGPPPAPSAGPPADHGVEPEPAVGPETNSTPAPVPTTGAKSTRVGRPVIRLAAIPLLLLVPVWIALAIWTTPTFRGSDQYWYVEDVSTIVRGGTQTHEVYPFSLIGTDARFQDRRGFVHDVPVLWVWAGAARVLGGDPHVGIIAINLLSTLGAAAFVYLAARRFLSRTGALAASLFFLYIPAVFFITTQDMAEPFSALFVALALWLVVRWRDRFWAYALAEAAIAVAAVGRIWTLPLLAVLPVGLLLFGEGRTWPRRLGRTAAALGVGLLAYLPLYRVFVSYIPPLDPMALLEVTRASNNMVLYFAVTPAPPFALAAFLPEVAKNAWAALVAQVSVTPRGFTITKSFVAADEWPANLAFLTAAAGLFIRGTDRLRRWLMVLAVLAFGMHMGMATLYQNQPRYLVPLLPAIVLGAAAAASRWWELGATRGWMRGVLVVVLIVAMAGFVAVDALNAVSFRGDAFKAGGRRARAVALVSATIPAGAPVALDTDYGFRWNADWAIFPRPELALGTNFGLTDDQYTLMLERFKPSYLVTDETSRLPALTALLSRTGPPVKLGTNHGYTVWKLPPNLGR